MKNFLLLILISYSLTIFSQEIYHPEGNYALINGAKIWYETEGEGEPLLIIPGGPGNSHTYFHPWFSELAKDYKIIYLDAFGRGKSDRAADPAEYTFARDVEDIELLRQTLQFKKWNLCGHSYGGMVAQAYALKYPESVNKVILSNSFYSGEMWQANNNSSNYELKNQLPEVWAKVKKLRDEGSVSSSPEHQEAYALPSSLLYYYDGTNASKVSRDSLIMNTEVYYTLVGYDGDFIIGGDVSKLDFRQDLKKLEMPMLIIEGRYDRIAIPKWSVKFREYAPQAELVMFEKSGHAPYIEETDKFFNLLNEFLSNAE